MSRSVILICSTVWTGCTSMEEPTWNALIQRSRFSLLAVAKVKTPSRLGCLTWLRVKGGEGEREREREEMREKHKF